MSDHRWAGGEEFELKLLALADDGAPPIIRLRRVAKALFRHYGFRLTSCRDVTNYPAPLPASAEESGTEPTPLLPSAPAATANEITVVE